MFIVIVVAVVYFVMTQTGNFWTHPRILDKKTWQSCKLL